MSTSSERALRAAANAGNAGGGAVINPDADRAQRLAAVEAAATQAIEVARQAAVAAQLPRYARRWSGSPEDRRARPRPPRHVAAAAQGLGEPRLLHL